MSTHAYGGAAHYGVGTQAIPASHWLTDVLDLDRDLFFGLLTLFVGWAPVAHTSAVLHSYEADTILPPHHADGTP